MYPHPMFCAHKTLFSVDEVKAELIRYVKVRLHDPEFDMFVNLKQTSNDNKFRGNVCFKLDQNPEKFIELIKERLESTARDTKHIEWHSWARVPGDQPGETVLKPLVTHFVSFNVELTERFMR